MRATSRTFVHYSLNGGVTWTRVPDGKEGEQFIKVGGTLVGVGSLHKGDTLKVETRSNGAYDEDTDMVPWSADNTSLKPPTKSWDQSGEVRDPRIVITTDDCASPSNYVLLGKMTSNADWNGGIETRVDLVHGPLSVLGSASLTACGGSCGAVLSPGRYLLHVFATTDMPVGAFTADPSTHHLSRDMPVLGADGARTTTVTAMVTPPGSVVSRTTWR